MTLKDDLDLTLPWDRMRRLLIRHYRQPRNKWPLEEYIAFLEDIDALRSPPLEIKEYKKPFTL